MTAVPRPPRRLERAASGRLLGGVGAGLAVHLGLSTVVVRVAFVALAVCGGLGVLLYAAFWVVVPQHAEPHDADPRPESRGQLLALAVLGAGIVLLVGRSGSVDVLGTLLPVGAALAGLALVWRQADEAQRARWRASASGPRGVLRVVAGGLLLAAGLAGFLAGRGDLGAARQGLLSTAVVVLGVGVLTGPFWVRLTADLRAERTERIRSQERAELAAHVHDSVLQTLALIQKAADDPREVTRLARSQGRALRGWLYRSGPRPALAAALERVAAEVEELHGTPVEVVSVGDCASDDRVEALVAATREAVVNAAKHSGAPSVQVYAEVEDDALSVFVRDRGAGFDPASVPPDRYGLAESVVGRMTRHGGRATVRSAPGDGTEVRLELPRG